MAVVFINLFIIVTGSVEQSDRQLQINALSRLAALLFLINVLHDMNWFDVSTSFSEFNFTLCY